MIGQVADDFAVTTVNFMPFAAHDAYRYRETIAVSAPPNKTVEWLGPDQQIRQPVTNLGPLQTFMVDYDWPSGQYRLLVDGVDSGLTIWVENFDTRPGGWNFTPPPEMQYPVQANFADKIELLGYNLPSRRGQAGDGFPLVLYWQSLAQMGQNYTMFVQLLDSKQQRWGGYDRLAREDYSTFLWVPGQVVDDGFAVPIAADAPDGVYTIRVGWYLQNDDDEILSSLSRVENNQILEETSVVLGPVKIGNGPTLATVHVSPENSLVETNFGKMIALAGFDWRLEASTLTLNLSWRALASPDTDYTVFVHLRNEAGETVAQIDAPPAAGQYPTSLWDKDDVITDSFAMDMSNVAPGHYKLVV